jgi:hypothetical protein
MHKQARIVVIIVLVILLGLFLGLQQGAANGGPVEDRAGGPDHLVEVMLRAEAPAAPGEQVTLTFEVTPLADAPELTIRWIAPEGVEMAEPAVETAGPVAAGETVRRQRQLTFAEGGIHKIAVEAGFSPHKSLRGAASGVLFFDVNASTPAVSDLPFSADAALEAPIAVTDVTVAPATSSRTPLDKPCFQISGRLTRIDKSITTGGYGANTRVPLANNGIELREDDPVFDDDTGFTWTDDNGNFEFDEFCEWDGVFQEKSEFYVRIRATSQAAKVTERGLFKPMYKFTSDVTDSRGGSLTLNLELNESQSAVYNIMESIEEAQDFWYENARNNDKIPRLEVRWESGHGGDGSFYNSVFNTMHLADDPSDPDEWDDVVIIHEWGHFIDDRRGCNDNPGGSHNFSGTFDRRLAFGEGFPNYYQSVVRDWRGDGSSQWYLDVQGSGNPFGANLETVSGLATNGGNFTIPNTIQNEAAVAGALWDLYDGVNDNQDTVEHGHRLIQDVFVSDEFHKRLFFPERCGFDKFVDSWEEIGNPADAVTAAAINQNTNSTATFGSRLVTAPARNNGAPDTSGEYVPDHRWWNRVGFLVDTSPSMAGELGAVQTVLREQLNDYAAMSSGTEFSLSTFHGGSLENEQVLQGQFFADTILPYIDGLSTGGSDNGCEVRAFTALEQAAQNERNMKFWLYTDGDEKYGNSGPLTQLLTDNQSRASFVLLGGCTPGTRRPKMTDEQIRRQQTAQRGRAATYLGPQVAAETPDGIVPYLLTAAGSGGQFLYVEQSQLDNAADVLRAQLSHSAGSGRWSDYVSERATYRWEELASWETNWISTTGTTHSLPGSNGYTTINIPSGGFDFYNLSQGGVRAFQDGYISMFSNSAADATNEPIPDPNDPDAAIYALWDDLTPEERNIPPGAPAGSEGVNEIYGELITRESGEWFVIEYNDFAFEPDQYYDFDPDITFQIQLNRDTNEIRLLYEALPTDGAASATIGVESGDPIGGDPDGVQISYNDAAGASAGMGYKLMPAPPQPDKTYTVTVDSTMESVGFLLTGFSGTFDVLDVRYPDGTRVDCNDTENVLCVDAGLVQYVQADVEGQTGEWQATVSAGSSGSGTFSFSSMAVSPLSPESLGDRSHSTTEQTTFLVDLGQATDDNQMAGILRTPTDQPFGAGFTFYDDGKHDDGEAGDGLFRSEEFGAPVAGTAYLWTTGTVDGEPFTRVDPAPYSFQPVSLTSLGDAASDGGTTALEFNLRNDDLVEHCYFFNVGLPEGWTVNFWDLFGPCLAPNESSIHRFRINMAASDLPSGTSGQVTVTAIESEKGEMTDSASARITRRRPPSSIRIFNPTSYLRPAGDTAELRFYVTDSEGIPVADGTTLTFNTSLGSMPASASVENGYVDVTFTSGVGVGAATITAETGNGVSAGTTIRIADPVPDGVTLEVSPATLGAGDDTATLTATATDPWGDPVAGQTVRIGVEGDGKYGTIAGGEVMTGTTNAAGQVTATFIRTADSGEVGIRAELLVSEGDDFEVIYEDRQRISLDTNQLYLPTIQRP